MSATLVIMAAGLGSRFKGGIKQLEPFGPNGEIIMDYSIFDAVRAGFDKVVFIIRRDIREAFDEMIGNRIGAQVKVDYVYQELDCLPEGFTVPADRVKPWGHGHAVCCCKGIVNEPFAVINADDFYGREAFQKLHDYLTQDTLLDVFKIFSNDKPNTIPLPRNGSMNAMRPDSATTGRPLRTDSIKAQ